MTNGRKIGAQKEEHDRSRESCFMNYFAFALKSIEFRDLFEDVLKKLENRLKTSGESSKEIKSRLNGKSQENYFKQKFPWNLKFLKALNWNFTQALNWNLRQTDQPTNPALYSFRRRDLGLQKSSLCEIIKPDLSPSILFKIEVANSLLVEFSLFKLCLFGVESPITYAALAPSRHKQIFAIKQVPSRHSK